MINAFNRPFLHVASRLQNALIRCLVDTGAAASCISKREFMKLDRQTIGDELQTPEGLQLSGPNGSELKIHGIYDIHIQVMNKAITHPFVVIDGLISDGILGIDFIAQQELVIWGTGRDTKCKFKSKLGKGDIFECAQSQRTPAVIDPFTGEHIGAVNQAAADPDNARNPQTTADLNSIRNSLTTENTDVTIIAKSKTTIPANSAKLLDVSLLNKNNIEIKSGLYITTNKLESPIEAIDLIIDAKNKNKMLIVNNMNENYEINRTEKIATAENVMDFKTIELIDNCQNNNQNPSSISSLSQPHTEPYKPHLDTSTPKSAKDKWDRIRAQINLDHLDRHTTAKYEKLFFEFLDVFSLNKYDIGHSDAVPHKIRLDTNIPLFTHQFKVPEAHKEEINRQLDNMVKSGCLELSTSPYNSPLFLVDKKDGSSRIVLDYRNINTHSLPDKYSIRDVRTCLDDIGKHKSSIFSCLDITSSYHQVSLDKDSRPATSFHIPGNPKYQWTRSPMGLAGSGSTFSKLMDIVLQNLENVINYIDDILCHAKSHDEGIRALRKIFLRLRQYGLKVNPRKCEFGLSKVNFLGFELNKDGIMPGKTKSLAIMQFPIPDTVRKIRQFLGLANYFRGFIRNFTEISAPLVALTTQSNSWRSGELNQMAMNAFNEIKSRLCQRPCLHFPDFNKEFTLYCDAAVGDATHKGGLGAILTQVDEEGTVVPISYLSRTLKPHEEKMTAYALEMKAATWAIKNYHHYLKGKKFIIISDNQPLVSNTNNNDRALNKLQQVLLDYEAELKHIPGTKNKVADALSRNAISHEQGVDPSCLETINSMFSSAITKSEEQFIMKQLDDENTAAIIRVIQGDANKATKQALEEAKNAYIDEKGILRKNLRKKFVENPAYLPQTMIREVLIAGHSSLYAGHAGEDKTLARVKEYYTWKNMTTDIKQFVKNCQTCQLAKSTKPPSSPLKSLPIPDGPNQRVHIDLMGPLKSSANYSYILVATDAFTKFAVTAPLFNKKASTIAAALMEKWICRFSCPKAWVSDNGKEFINNVMTEMNNFLKISHLRTTPYHPQTNSSAESYNRSIIKYMKTALSDNESTEWHKLLPQMELAYNTTIHRTINTTPFALTYTYHPSLPYFDLEKPNKFYNPNQDKTKLIQHLRRIFKEAYEANKGAIKTQEHYFNKKSKEREFNVGDQVMVWSTKLSNDALNQNKKFLDNFVGPYIIMHKANDQVFKVAKFPHSKPFLVNIDRIKHFKFTQLFDKNYAGPDVGENNEPPKRNTKTAEEPKSGPSNQTAKTPRKQRKQRNNEDDDPDYIPRQSARLRNKINNNTHHNPDTPIIDPPIWKNPTPPQPPNNPNPTPPQPPNNPNPINPPQPSINPPVPPKNPVINNSTKGKQPNQPKQEPTAQPKTSTLTAMLRKQREAARLARQTNPTRTLSEAGTAATKERRRTAPVNKNTKILPPEIRRKSLTTTSTTTTQPRPIPRPAESTVRRLADNAAAALHLGPTTRRTAREHNIVIPDTMTPYKPPEYKKRKP